MTLVEQRSRDVGRAIVSSRLEGLEPTDLFLEVADAYASGSITWEQLLEIGKRRCHRPDRGRW